MNEDNYSHEAKVKFIHYYMRNIIDFDEAIIEEILN